MLLHNRIIFPRLSPKKVHYRYPVRWCEFNLCLLHWNSNWCMINVIGLIGFLYHIVRFMYIRFGVSCPKILPRNPPIIYFLTAWQHWLGIAKPKNAFRSTLCIKLLWNFLFNRFFYWLSIWLMPSDKRNSITTRAIGLISSLFNVTSSRDVPFANHCNSNAHIMVLPNLLSFVLDSFLHYRVGDNLW